jgi:single-strand DNA-binding protein
MDANVCTFTGRLTRDAETRMVGETDVARYAIAIHGRKDKVLFLDCDHWRAGGVAEYLTKGTQVCVTGEIELQQWEKDGQPKSKTVLQVRNLTLLGGKKRDESSAEEFTASPF